MAKVNIVNRKDNLGKRWLFYLAGALMFALGLVLMIKADLGVAPWDVLNVGLYLQLGLTIGSWNVIIGAILVIASSIAKKSWPQAGTFFNVIAVGAFVDLFLFLLRWFEAPENFFVSFLLLIIGVVILCYGASFCIAANIGAGPRDDIMMVIIEKTGWKIQWVRGLIESIVLFLGWLLQGPIHIGTLVIWISMGFIYSVTIPQSRRLLDLFIGRMQGKDFNQGTLWVNDQDGVGQ